MDTYQFEDQQLLIRKEDEVCRFSSRDIDVIRHNFPTGTIFQTPNPSLWSDQCSLSWVCFPLFPFQMGLYFPFPKLITEFFLTTGLAYTQVLPSVWRVLYWIVHLNQVRGLSLGLPEIAQVYDLYLMESHRVMFKLKTGRVHLVQNVHYSEEGWKNDFFFVLRSSLPEGELLPGPWDVTVADFAGLSPAREDTEIKIREFVALSVELRSYKFLPSLDQEDNNASLLRRKDQELNRREEELAKMERTCKDYLGRVVLDMKMSVAKAVLKVIPIPGMDPDNLSYGEVMKVYSDFVEGKNR